jgi:hypothetical protein
LLTRAAIGGVDGALTGFTQSYYDERDLERAFADAAWGLGVGAATGGIVHMSSRCIPLVRGWASTIASGHAWTKHAGDWARLGFKRADQLKSYIERVMLTGGKALKGGRWAWFDKAKGVVVIFDPRNPDGGTAFIPRDGIRYFNELQ